MTRFRGLAVVSVVLTLAIPVLAGGGPFTGAREIQVAGEALFGGQELAEGTYRLSWERNGSADLVEVRLLKGRRLLATIPARVVERETASHYDSVVYNRNGSGKLELTEIRFAGSRSAISLKDGGATDVARGR